MKKLSIIFLFLALPVHADTSISGVISTNTTWSPAGGIYVLETMVTIPAEVTLTIEPGTIIKSKLRSTGFDVYGTLIARGNTSSPIYFTSFQDDAVGDDTNGDGNSSFPSIVDWMGIAFRSGSSGEITYSVIKYSGNFDGFGRRAGLFNYGGDVSVDYSLFSNNFQSDIYQNAGSLSLTKNKFENSFYGIILEGGSISLNQNSFNPNNNGLDNRTGVTIDARNNWWGSEFGPTPSGAISWPTTGSFALGLILFDPWLISDPTLESLPEQHIDPVIIVPGIMGSAYKNGELVIDPILHTYDDLIATLDENGYTPSVDLFTFPYEWRDSNVLSANLLKDKIAEVKSVCNCNKVDIIAHSMGGLVAREYIQSGQYQNDIDQAIFLGTPHKGAPKAYLQWEAGQFPPGLLESLQKQFFTVEAFKHGYSSLFNYVQNRPISSVRELLPIFDYLKDKDTGIVRQYSTNYPRNIFLEALNNNTGLSALLNSGVRITNIVGDFTSTINIIRIGPGLNPLWIDGKPDGFDGQTVDRGLEMGTGDGTVTINGSTLDNSIPNEVWTGVDHSRLPRETEARVFNILTNKVATTVVFLTPIEKILSIRLHSPVDMVIVAPDGKKIGKNFSNGTEYSEISAAFYSGFNTDEEYITIPNPLDGEYKIQLQGTGSGKYTVDTSYVSEAVSTTTEVVGTTIPGQINNLTVKLDNSTPSDLSLDPDLVADINKSFEVGWIKDKKIRDQLLNKANAIIKFEKKIETVPDGKNKQKKIEKLNKKIDKKAANALLVALKGYNKDKITIEGYNLLKGDLEWIINH